MAKKEIKYIMNRMKPCVNELPGTEMYFARERTKLLAMISSPVTTTHGQWTWFFTEAQPDLFQAEIYDNAVSSAVGLGTIPWNQTLEERQQRSNNLTAEQRSHILRDHPFMSVRMHVQQAAYWAYILNGEDKPLGEILDSWLRAEFQMKGTPHWHTLINIAKRFLLGINADSVASDDIDEQRKVTALVANVANSWLLPRDDTDMSELPDGDIRTQLIENEREWAYNIYRPKYFQDASHPSRHRFVAAGRDYSINSAGIIPDKNVRRLYRRLQIANQFHSCRESCWKYCQRGQPKICRFGYSKEPIPENQESAVIVREKDGRNRLRIKVQPQRNNGNINVHLRSPLCFISGRGNQHIQYTTLLVALSMCQSTVLRLKSRRVQCHQS